MITIPDKFIKMYGVYKDLLSENRYDEALQVFELMIAELEKEREELKNSLNSLASDC